MNYSEILWSKELGIFFFFISLFFISVHPNKIPFSDTSPQDLLFLMSSSLIGSGLCSVSQCLAAVFTMVKG